jgi:hypothetical protein
MSATDFTIPLVACVVLGAAAGTSAQGLGATSAAQEPLGQRGAAQRFGVTRTMLPPADAGTEVLVALDVDLDGDLDLFVGGAGGDRLYRNDGTGAFRDVSHWLPPATDPARAAAAGDVDGDGHPDLVIGTSAGTDRLLLFDRGRYVDASDRLPVDTSKTYAVALGDVNGDLALDVWLGNPGNQDRLYLNDGSGGFTDGTGAIPIASESVADVALGDADGDGDLDAVIGVGHLCWAPSLQNRLYLGDGLGGFVDAPGRLPVDADVTVAVELGDVDGDGDPDLVLGNARDCSTSGAQNRLYLNDGMGGFLDATGRLPALLDETLACALADTDGDGDLDLVVGNAYDYPFPGNGLNRLCVNDGSGNFTEPPGLLPALAELTRALAAVDVDADGDVDLLVGNGGTDRLHLNDSTGVFSVTETVLPPSPTSVVGLGDVNADGHLDAFAVTPIFDMTPYVPTKVDQRLFLGDGAGFFTESSGDLPGLTRVVGEVAFGDVDADGDLDLLLACPYDGEYYPVAQDNLLLLNDGSGKFTDGSGQLPTFPGDDRGVPTSVELVDVDRDGHLDAVFSNRNDYDGGGSGIALFLNDGLGTFTDASGQVSYLGNDPEHVVAGDVDGDGDTDLVAGADPLFVYLMLNDGSGTFVDAGGQLPALSELGSTTYLDLGDVDGDGALDLVFGRVEWSGSGPPNRLYRNDGAGVFTDDSAAVAQVRDEYRLADVDGDGDLDLLGEEALLENDGGARFTPTVRQLPAAPSGRLALGDVDGDGDLDALVSPGAQAVVWSNLTRHLAWRGLPRIGKELALEVHGSPRAPWLVAWAPTTAPLAVPPLGTLHLPPATATVAGSGTLDPGGRATLGFAVPADPTLVGAALHWQALVGWPLRLTNREVTTFSGL